MVLGRVIRRGDGPSGFALPAHDLARPRLTRPPRHWPRSDVHGFEELLVGLGALHLVEQELHRLDRVELREQLAQDPDPVERAARQQELFLAGRRALDIDGRKNAFFEQPTVERNLLIAGALELLEDHLVHPAAGIDWLQCRRSARVAGGWRRDHKLLSWKLWP